MKTVLIIEDDSFLVDAYKAKMTHAAWRVLSATNGQAGYELAVAEKPDVIILDLIMAGLTGLETLKLLKSAPETKDIPVMVATNIDQEDSQQRAQELGAADYFIKSNVSIGDLLKKCESYL